MGEYSKRIGEIGEEIVADFLNLIGWTNPQRNLDIPSINPQKHQKDNHGIDFFFHYKSPMISNTIENVIISSKFSNDSYPGDKGTVTKFKAYHTDIAIALESFKKSTLRNTIINSQQNISSAFDRGIIFWINNHENNRIELSTRLLKIDTLKDAHHEGIFLVDNNRLEFIYDSLSFTRTQFPSADIQFLYFSTGLNDDDTNSRNGLIMPIQYITSNILPLRVEKNNEITLILFAKEQFNKDSLVKLMGLAKNIGMNLATSTIIGFPDYNTVNHEQIANSVKQVFTNNDSANDSFTNRISIVNFNSSIRG